MLFTLKTKIREKSSLRALYSSLLLLLVGYLAFFLSKEICEYARLGVKLCTECIIPTIFPFLILTDFYLAYGHTEWLGIIKGAISKLFGIEYSGADAIICGWLTGFPIGVKQSCELYRRGRIKKENAELLSALSSLPSPAFIVASTAALFKSIRFGILAVLCVYLSSIATGLIFRSKDKNIDNAYNISRQRFNFISSVKDAGLNMINICSFIIFFSAVVGIVKRYVKDKLILAIALPFLELTNAVDYITKNVGSYSFLFLGFALGFGGFSVIMQSASFLKEVGLSLKRHFTFKLCQGLICAIIMHFIFYIIPLF